MTTVCKNKVLTTESNTTFMEGQDNGVQMASKVKFLKSENRLLNERISDLETTLKINKEIVTSLILNPDQY